MRHIGFILFNDALALDAVGPAEVFAMANRTAARRDNVYQLEVLSIGGGAVRTLSGFEICTRDANSLTDSLDTLIVVGGRSVEAGTPQPELVSWLQRVAPHCRRVCSVCTGAFLLAAAGLLEGRRAVTHWDSGTQFRRLYPSVGLELDPIYINDGPIWTSAGVTAGVDMALALVEEDLGRTAALAIAKQMVVFLHRPGGQAQFSNVLSAQARALNQKPDHKFYELHTWIADHLADDLSVDALARRVRMSTRSFTRYYVRLMGSTPAKAVEQLRLEAAKRALERGDASIKRVADTCGFGDDERLRRSFLRNLGVPPDAYRARFSRHEAIVVPGT
jgi:transcriptional regulator GlxA family with amidase domain